ncbi:hypothetical protein [Bifidobacterium jacchi]|uniref:Uncharacterized protein n=1 Tax=Bifidobacterium jacchi TaxID=2490545 RepID=A0A5N5RMN4_9BIFI|nr:hypothetical protein [Bifidobacterium jacchi]KAB5608383.1 hypothetical protein EHS19_01810 [Bifidobacterium jacchi]
MSDDMLARLLALIADEPDYPGISRDEPVVVEYYANLGKTIVTYRGFIELDGDALSPLFATSHTWEKASSPIEQLEQLDGRRKPDARNDADDGLVRQLMTVIDNQRQTIQELDEQVRELRKGRATASPGSEEA